MDAFSNGPLKATRRPEIPDGKRREKRLDRLRLQGFWPVYALFVLLAVRPPLAEVHVAHVSLRFAGLGLAVLGIIVRVWSMGYLLKKEELATAGPYGRTRNPFYVGTWLIGSGMALTAAWPYGLGLLLVFNGLFYAIYRAQIAIEEEMLGSIYGAPYDEYRDNVPRFFPSIAAWTTGNVSRFSLARAMRNRAWEPLLGIALLLLLQAASWGLLWPLIAGESLGVAWSSFIADGWIR